jgi:TP901 family phage tail tape measure protein
LSLAQAIATADTPVTRVNAKLKELGTTLANTARWQISSSILHGFMGAIQSAYGYAQDLNESLNDIRIVTGKSTDEMARFAKQANDAAKALSATTNEYAEASLIYFQQGDNMEAVEEKAAITVKMAQVTGQGMETVSDQMTAVWNNFYDGSQSLEHYADAMARLGAITASSSDEIA